MVLTPLTQRPRASRMFLKHCDNPSEVHYMLEGIVAGLALLFLIPLVISASVGFIQLIQAKIPDEPHDFRRGARLFVHMAGWTTSAYCLATIYFMVRFVHLAWCTSMPFIGG